jgi:hypothetical protein
LKNVSNGAEVIKSENWERGTCWRMRMLVCCHYHHPNRPKSSHNKSSHGRVFFSFSSSDDGWVPSDPSGDIACTPANFSLLSIPNDAVFLLLTTRAYAHLPHASCCYGKLEKKPKERTFSERPSAFIKGRHIQDGVQLTSSFKQTKYKSQITNQEKD